jgi:Ca-activated chloride channel homolog
LRLLKGLAVVCLSSCTAGAQHAVTVTATIPVLIQDSHHRPALNVTRELLAVNQHKLAVTDFSLSSAAALPLRLGILLDVSGTERESSQRLTAAASAFAINALRNQEDRVFFGAFNIKLITTDWTDRAGVERVVVPANVGGGTALYDGIVGACKHMGEVDWAKPSRRVLVVISDGEDNQSDVTLQHAAAEAVRSGVVIFGVSTSGSGLYLRGDRVMENLARLTGGKMISLSAREAPKALAKISELMNALYLLNYVPASASPKEQDIEIKSASKEKMYFSWPQFPSISN